MLAAVDPSGDYGTESLPATEAAETAEPDREEHFLREVAALEEASEDTAEDTEGDET